MSRPERRRLERIRFKYMASKKSMPILVRSDRRAYTREMGLHKLREV